MRECKRCGRLAAPNTGWFCKDCREELAEGIEGGIYPTDAIQP